MAELIAVLSRPKFASYIEAGDVKDIVHAFAGVAEIVPVAVELAVCRDPNDDKFLALAVAGSAHIIVTGDDDLLCLHPFQGVAVLTPRQFLEAFSEVEAALGQ